MAQKVAEAAVAVGNAAAVMENAAAAVESAVGGGEKRMKTISSKLGKCVSTLELYLGKHTVSIMNVILTAFVIGGEELLEIHVFRCPSEHSFAYDYSLTFILGIGLALFFFAIAAYKVTWKILHGCFCLTNFCSVCCGDEKDRNCCCCKCVSKSDFTCLDACFHQSSRSCYSLTISVFVKSLILPAAWCFICLWDGDYLACMMSETPGDSNSTDYIRWKHTSRMYGYVALPGLLFILILFQGIYRCCIPHTYMFHRYVSVYRECEENAFREMIPANAKQLAENVVTTFLDQDSLKKEDWKHTSEFISDNDVLYSPLHEHVTKKTKRTSCEEKANTE